MYDFILQTIFVGSLAVTAVMAARALPRVEPDENPRPFYAYAGEWLGRLPLHHLDDRANAFLFKILKRFRVVILKIDNRLLGHLDRVKKTGERQAPSVAVQQLIDHIQDVKKDGGGDVVTKDESEE